MSDHHASLTHLIAPAVAALGYELWGCVTLPQGGRTLLRVYIDQPQGIEIADCVRASHQINGILAVENPLSGNYTLEVSSPGLDRPLFTADHFHRCQGQMIQCKTKIPLAGSRRFSGRLSLSQENTVQLQQEDGQVITLTLDNIERANILPDFLSVK